MSSADGYGIGIDLGTTTIAAALVRIPEGDVLARVGCLNPQKIHGLDVISRLQYASGSAEKLREMQSLVNSALSAVAEELLKQAGIDSGRIERVTIAGNPAMSHLLLGLPVESLVHPPYRPRHAGVHRLRSGELDWEGDYPLYVFPSPGGFVGGDTVAFLYGQGFPEPGALNPEPALFLDLGTNGEIVIAAHGRLYATSAAAGPAFEGGNLSCGMAALPGAIFSVEEHGGRLVAASIDNAHPEGVCGSGALDVVALLLREGLLDSTGRLLAPSESSSPLAGRIQEIGGERCFVVYRDAKVLISLSQEDIRQVQLAKGAVRAAMEVLLVRAGIGIENLRKVVLTGSFGAAIRFDSLKSVGVLTENMVKSSGFVRDGALAGTVRALCAADADQQIEMLSSSLTIVPLSGTPLFESHFMAHINFPVK